MSTENHVDTEVSLDDFSAEFFGQTSDTPTEATEEVKPEDQEIDAPETNEDTQPEDDALEQDDETDELQQEEPAPKPKKNRFQERIDELTTARREAERREQALAAKLEALEAKFNQNEKPTPAPQVKEDTGPQPTDTNDDGSEKYPLGEFDPNYIRDLTRHELSQQLKAQQEATAKDQERLKIEAAQAQLQTEWNEKITPAQERYPDFQEKGQQLVDSFSDLDPAYSQYLANTLMEMEYGPDVLYYLASNPDEAQKIIKSGATKATIALGRIESKFALAEAEKQIARPKVSQAPTPPSHLNKGSDTAKPAIRGDEDDLDLFEKEFLKKKR